MEARDIGAVARLHRDYQAQFKLTPVFSEDECAHWLLPRDKVVSSYVVEDPATGDVVDFTSFYALNSTVIGHPRHKALNAAYAFYTTSFKVPLKQILYDALIMANKKGFDVFNALDLMHNGDVLKDLKFGIGDGNLQYYLYNYAHPEIEPKDVGLVLL
jgi:glycylpeptide N-tetradecanoyltransferase